MIHNYDTISYQVSNKEAVQGKAITCYMLHGFIPHNTLLEGYSYVFTTYQLMYVLTMTINANYSYKLNVNCMASFNVQTLKVVR